jgi:hypothetical protein
VKGGRMGGRYIGRVRGRERGEKRYVGNGAGTKGQEQVKMGIIF